MIDSLIICAGGSLKLEIFGEVTSKKGVSSVFSTPRVFVFPLCVVCLNED